jgi:hypothetical protein
MFFFKLQQGLSPIEMWCKHWNLRINEDKIHSIYFSHRLRPPEAHLTLNEWNVKYLCVIFNKRSTLRLHIKMTEAKAF